LKRGILAFAAAKADQARSAGGQAGADLPLQLSALLIGAGEGGPGQSACAQALLRAASGAQAILLELPNVKVRLETIEIVELFEDRAVATWRAINGALKTDPGLAEEFNLEPDLKQTSGGRRSAPVGRDPTWWQPIQITMSGEARNRGLSFTVSGGLARAEARVIAANLDLVAPLVRRARSSALGDSPNTPGRTLFELLWPAALKDQSAEDRPRRLTLDERSACFPWEMLDDRRPWMSDETRVDPPSVRTGLVRQLLQTRFREGMVTPRGKPKALIVGNPLLAPTGMPPLPNAEAEAKTIAAALGPTHDVALLAGSAAGPEQITRRLFTEAWDIIHISAHGVSNQSLAGPDGKKQKRTGIVFGGGVVLTASALAKLPVSPGIVFVNCCYLGVGQTDLEGRPEFAANVAVELIKLGARCVIAAGWEVNDLHAAAFSKRFYEGMLRGETFGEATLAARKDAYLQARDAGRDDNTWGAFQCYGDPDYRLRVSTSSRGSGSGELSFVAVSEAVEAARQIRDELNIGVERKPDDLRSRLEGIEGASENWDDRAELRVALAEAWGELGNLPKAIGHYEAAVGGEDATFTVKAIEQLANLRARNAVANVRSAPPETRDAAKAEQDIRAALASIEDLTRSLGETTERLSLQGGCWKRLAQIRPAKGAADEALKEMAGRYDRAAELANGEKKFYPQLMACSARICDAIRMGTTCDARVKAQLKALIDLTPPEDASFWQLILWADASMNETILDSPDPLVQLSSLETSYRRAWRHVGSPVKLRSVIEQLEFYEDIFSDGDPATASKRQSVSTLAKSLRNTLEVEFLDRSPT
jgi:tetratricopeptide (TPR) repeat protein